MKKILVALTTVLAFCVGQPASAGIGFGIPLPIPFLVWTPSNHCGQGSGGSCRPRSQGQTTAVPKSITARIGGYLSPPSASSKH
jgi:hypothetical protein